MCRKAKVSRFFIRLCAVEEALKTAKSSLPLPISMQYSFWAVCLAVSRLPFSIPRLPCTESASAPDPHPEPEQAPQPVLCRIQVGEATEWQTKKSNNAMDAYQCNLMSVYISSFYSCAFLFLFFHIFLLIEFQFDCSFLWARNDGTGRYLIVEWLIVWVLLGFHVAHFVVSQSSCLQSFFGCMRGSLFLQYWWIARLTSWWISLQNIAEYLLCMRLIHI